MPEPRRNIYIADSRAGDILDKLPPRKVSELITLLVMSSDLNADTASRDIAAKKLEIFTQEYK